MQNFSHTSLKLCSEYVEPNVLESFAIFLETDDFSKLEDAAVSIAGVLGGAKFITLLLSQNESERYETEQKLIKSFHNNLQLLVKKTWVEKSDETEKEQLLVRLDKMCKELSNKKYNESYEHIISVLNDAVLLMFGENAVSEDFAEYALRIDPGFGTFWCFLKSLPEHAQWQMEKTRMALLLGMCFLANY
ncbi:MAG: hypothetical protein ACTTHG_02130 [Treponemataceae bacterium]